MTEVTVCDGCKKYDNNVIIDGKHYCKTCFDNQGLDYVMMDLVEHNRENFEALGWDMDNAEQNSMRKLYADIKKKREKK